MIRDSLIFKPIAIVLAAVFLYQLFYPTVVLGLTSGPSQPETQSFTPASVSEMVNPFTGDFSYNIPLMDIGGYPIGLSYSSGISSEQEASWVGLGWNINPGVISRNVRGLPDDFNGDQVTTEANIKANSTYGAGSSTAFELVGFDLLKKASTLGLQVGFGAKYNNYTGAGLDVQISPSLSSGSSAKDKYTGSLGLDLSLGTSGVSISPSVSFSKKMGETDDNTNRINTRIGSSFNSRTGMQSMTMSNSFSQHNQVEVKKTDEQGKETTEMVDVTIASKNMSSGHLSFATPSYTPSISQSFKNSSISLSMSLVGIAFFGTDTEPIRINGYYSTQRLKKPVSVAPSFGFLYYQNGQSRLNAVLDFNREKDIGYSKEVKNLPVTSPTYDIFSVSGEGIGGSYRLYRNDVGTVFDNINTNTSEGLDLSGPEIGFGGTNVKGGLNLGVNSSISYSLRWLSGNQTKGSLNYRKAKVGEIAEPVYFRKSGEKNVLSDQTLLNNFGGFEPISFDVTNSTHIPSAKSSFTDRTGATDKITTDPDYNLNTKRQARNEAIIHYTAEEAEVYGMFKKIRNYGEAFSLNANGTYNFTPENRYSAAATLKNVEAKKAHHLSEINVYSGDGRRYVYSDPIYNFIKEELTYATNESGTELVNHIDISDPSKHDQGLDHYYNKVVTPAYPTAFLLSAIVSPDYLDIDDIEGPSDGDLGNYTKFNYTKLSQRFKWRTPTELGKASFNEGFKTKSGDKGDNKAIVTYGEKEVKYLHSIETKTHVAEFVMADRLDGKGVVDNNGGNTGASLRYLVEIRLYSKEDRINNPQAVPIKTVHFDYFHDKDGNPLEYELCPQTPNSVASNKGKLTLKKVWFTYGESKRGQLSPYYFTYGSNPAYGKNTTDRWGTYQPNSGTPDNSEYAYTDQTFVNNAYKADQNAAAWNLSKIDLPSGGVIDIDYEADDYAYVQNRKAMQMFKVAGFFKNADDDPVNTNTQKLLYDSQQSTDQYQYLKIKIPTDYPRPIENGVERAFTANDFMRGISQLYFKMFTNADENITKKEYVMGYMQLVPSSEYTPTIIGDYLTIKVKKSKDCNPVSYAMFNLMTKHFPRTAYQQGEPGKGVMETFEFLLSSIIALKTFVQGANNSLKQRGMGKVLDTCRSWVRLNNPNGFKKGGGHRVKKITINDNWSNMAAGNHMNSLYGQEYDYTFEDDRGNVYSSGVAAYEPVLGNDENPFRQPRFYEVDKLLVPDEEFYVEEPMGESAFPAPSIGYRKVTIKNLTYDDVDNEKNGKTVKEYYTAFDFPTITKEVTLRAARNKSSTLAKLFNLSAFDYVATTQGYLIELNDMHGKEKAEWIYQEGDISPYSGIEYKYKQNGHNRISSKGLVVDKSGNISEEYLGLELDLVNDVRHSNSTITSTSADLNNDFFVIPAGIPIPVNLIMIRPTYSMESTNYNSIVVSKVIKRHGLLDEVVYHTQKSQVGVTKNLIRDAESGEVILTQVENEFGDPIYKFNYPAYWAYDDMGPVYKSMDLKMERNDIGFINQYLKIGDQVLLTEDSKADINAWVSVVDGSNTKLIDKDGLPITWSSAALLRIINPINTNQQGQTIGEVTTLTNPLVDTDNDGNPDDLMFMNVISANAMEYTEQASIFCNCGPATEGTPYNPFVRGTKGLWKPWRSYNYLTARTQSRTNNDINARHDGKFNEFNPFWTKNPVLGKDWQPNYNQWIYTAEASIFNPKGNELESRDALGRYSSAIFGYKDALPTAVAKNARYQHIAFDGFEDYRYDPESCENDHFSYEQKVEEVNIVEEEAHTGRKSIKVSANGTNGSSGSYVLRKVLIKCE